MGSVRGIMPQLESFRRAQLRCGSGQHDKISRELLQINIEAAVSLVDTHRSLRIYNMEWEENTTSLVRCINASAKILNAIELFNQFSADETKSRAKCARSVRIFKLILSATIASVA